MTTTRAVLNVYDRNPTADPSVVLAGLNDPDAPSEVAFHAPWALIELRVVGTATLATFEGTAQSIPEDVQLETYVDVLGDELDPEIRVLLEDLGWKVDGVYVDVGV